MPPPLPATHHQGHPALPRSHQPSCLLSHSVPPPCPSALSDIPPKMLSPHKLTYLPPHGSPHGWPLSAPGGSPVGPLPASALHPGVLVALSPGRPHSRPPSAPAHSVPSTGILGPPPIKAPHPSGLSPVASRQVLLRPSQWEAPGTWACGGGGSHPSLKWPRVPKGGNHAWTTPTWCAPSPWHSWLQIHPLGARPTQTQFSSRLPLEAAERKSGDRSLRTAEHLQCARNVRAFPHSRFSSKNPAPMIHSRALLQGQYLLPQPPEPGP